MSKDILAEESVELDSITQNIVDNVDDALVNPPATSSPVIRGFPCEFCGKFTQTKNGLHKHKRRNHDQERRQGMKFPCGHEGCNTAFATLGLLRRHYNSKHDFEANEVSAQFPTWESFEQWKENEEQTTYAKFIVKDRRSAGQKGRTRIIYWCHRSGEANEFKNSLNRKGPRAAAKIGVVCTATMTVFVNQNGSVDLTYYPEHWGHENDVEFLFLSKEQRQEIARQLQSGISPDEIIEACQNSENLRLRKATRGTIYRVCRDYRIPWIWGKQGGGKGESSSKKSASAQNSKLSDLEDSIRLEEVFDPAMGSSGEQLPIQRQTLESLERLQTMILSGAVPSEEDLGTLQILEQRIQEQLTTGQVPTTCLVILEAAGTNEVSQYSEVPPKDVNVAIINYDGSSF